MDTWAETVRRRAKAFERFPLIQNLERLVTNCLEQVVVELNLKMQKTYKDLGGTLPDEWLITTHEALNTQYNADTKKESIRSPSLYPTILMFAAQEFLEQHKKPGARPLNSQEKDALHQMAHFLDAEREDAALTDFIAKHHLPLQASGLDYSGYLKRFIQDTCREIIHDALQGKPSNPPSKPDPNGWAR